MSIVLVPTIPLVSQQASYLANNSGLKVGQLFGAMNTTAVDQEGWAKYCSEYNVIVCTPLILLNGMDRGFVSMDMVCDLYLPRLICWFLTNVTMLGALILTI